MAREFTFDPPVRRRQPKRSVEVCRADEIAPGERKLVEVDGKRIGVFNVSGEYYALLDFCPHNGGRLCQGPVSGTPLETDDYEFIYGHQDALLRCAWHGWEFDIATGQCLVDEKLRAKTYPVSVENGSVMLHI